LGVFVGETTKVLEVIIVIDTNMAALMALQRTYMPEKHIVATRVRLGLS
jgi:hypothetical protein